MSMKKIRGAILAGAVLAGGYVVTTTPYAEAVGGNCSSVRQEIDVFGPNAYRVRAKCTSLQGDSKARGVLDISGDTDKRTEWFTTVNKYYYSDSYKCVWGQCNNTRVEIARR
ncbi:hypothetical protein [Nocardioides zeae]|jgi:hypothetical protein